MRTVATFTDTYLPTINGVSYTVNSWRDSWQRRDGRMAVVYPDTVTRSAEADEYPVPSAPFPFYQGFRFAAPTIPDAVKALDPEIVHAHTPFMLGLTARYLAADLNVPLVASYHTPAKEYAEYISDALAGSIRWGADRYERWFFEGADAVVVPSQTAAEAIGDIRTPVHVVSNGVDTTLFRPIDPATVTAFRNKYGLPAGPLVGYTGRHGHEKRLNDILAATDCIDAEVVIAGDGPMRETLEQRAASRDDVSFIGFLGRDELPTFYTALDAFAFPSPVETQGLVALESIVCGTPVVAAAAGALTETVSAGDTGAHFEPGNITAFRDAIGRVLDDSEELPTQLEQRRKALCIGNSIDKLQAVYDSASF